MSESKVREFKAIEERARFAAKRKSSGPKVLDRFGRQVIVDDGILLAQTQPMEVLWRVLKMTPATEPDYQGGVWLDVIATTRVLAGANIPNPPMILGHLAPEEEAPGDNNSLEHNAPPAAGVSPGGIILSDPDGLK